MLYSKPPTNIHVCFASCPTPTFYPNSHAKYPSLLANCLLSRAFHGPALRVSAHSRPRTPPGQRTQPPQAEGFDTGLQQPARPSHPIQQTTSQTCEALPDAAVSQYQVPESRIWLFSRCLTQPHPHITIFETLGLPDSRLSIWFKRWVA